MSKPTAIDLFAGLGGMSLGLERAGFDVLVAVEMNADAAATHRLMQPKTKVFHGDALDVEEYEPGRRVDLVAGGSPCQAFSKLGYRQGIDDVRGRLVTAVPSVALELGAQAFLLENVPQFVTWDGGSAFRSFSEDVGRFFKIKHRVLNAADYGVPQVRNRVLVVGFLDEKAADRFTWPEPFDRQITADEAIGNGYKKPAPTLTANEHKASRAFGSKGAKTDPRHSGDRMGKKITVEEALVLQGLPAVTPKGTVASRYKQIGNAVPPPLIEQVARQIRVAMGM